MYQSCVGDKIVAKGTGLKQTWEIGSFSMKTMRYVGKRS